MNQKKRVVLTVCAAAVIVSLVPFRSLPSATMVKGQEMATALPETTPAAVVTSTPVPTEIPATPVPTPAVPVKKLPSVKKSKGSSFFYQQCKADMEETKEGKVLSYFCFDKERWEIPEEDFDEK